MPAGSKPLCPPGSKPLCSPGSKPLCPPSPQSASGPAQSGGSIGVRPGKRKSESAGSGKRQGLLALEGKQADGRLPQPCGEQLGFLDRRDVPGGGGPVSLTRRGDKFCRQLSRVGVSGAAARRGQAAPADHRHVPRSVVVAPGADDLPRRQKRKDAFAPSSHVDHAAQAVALDGGLFESLGRGEARQPLHAALPQAVEVSAENRARGRKRGGVGVAWQRAGRGAAVHDMQMARGLSSAGLRGKTRRACAQAGVVGHKLGGLPRRLAGSERAEGGRRILQGKGRRHLEPRVRFVRQRKPRAVVWTARPAIVRRVEFRDLAQFQDPRLEHGRCFVDLRALGQVRHLGHALPCFRGREILAHARTEIGRGADLEKLSERDEITFGGIITAVSERFSQKTGKPFGIVTLQDFKSSGELALFGDDWARWNGLMKENYTIFITAKCQPRYRNSNLFELKVQNVEQLYDVKKHRLERFTIMMDTSAVDDRTVSELVTLVERNEGDTQLYIELHTADQASVTLHYRNKGIDIDRTLLDFIASEENMEYKIN